FSSTTRKFQSSQFTAIQSTISVFLNTTLAKSATSLSKRLSFVLTRQKWVRTSRLSETILVRSCRFSDPPLGDSTGRHQATESTATTTSTRFLCELHLVPRAVLPARQFYTSSDKP